MLRRLGLWTVENGPYDGYSYAGFKLKQALERKNVQIVHNDYSEIALAFVPPNHYDKVRGEFRIGYSPWESTKIPDGWLKHLNSMDSIWTTSSFCSNVFKANGYERDVRVLLHGVDHNDYTLSWRKKTSPFVFLHIGEPAEHKRGQIVLDAFNELFKKSDNVRLIIKAREFISARNRNPFGPATLNKNVIAMPKVISISMMNSLYHSAHCLVYPSSGEGFGLIPLQGIATGLPTIIVPWGGVKEFEEYGFSIQYSMAPAQGYYYGLGEWAEPSYDNLCETMLDIYARYALYSEFAYNNGQALSRDKRFDWDTIAEKAIEYIGDDVMAVTSDKVSKKGARTTKKEVPEEVQKFIPNPDTTPDVLKEVLESPSVEEEKILIKMERTALTWRTSEGVQFSKEHPYQLVTSGEADRLLMEGGFRRAHPDEVKDWYAEE